MLMRASSTDICRGGGIGRRAVPPMVSPAPGVVRTALLDALACGFESHPRLNNFQEPSRLPLPTPGRLAMISPPRALFSKSSPAGRSSQVLQSPRGADVEHDPFPGGKKLGVLEEGLYLVPLDPARPRGVAS